MEKKWTRLIAARKANKFTQTEVAEKCGVALSTYSRWETLVFQPNINQLKTLSIVLNVPIDYLVYNDLYDVGDLDYWIQLAEVRNAYRRLITEHPQGVGKYKTKEEMLEFIATHYAPGPYSINPEDLETEPSDNQDPFRNTFDDK